MELEEGEWDFIWLGQEKLSDYLYMWKKKKMSLRKEKKKKKKT